MFAISGASVFLLTVELQIIFVIKKTFSCLQKLLEKCVLLFYQKKVQILVFWEVYNDTCHEPLPKFRGMLMNFELVWIQGVVFSKILGVDCIS